jgi:hypothetical protein
MCTVPAAAARTMPDDGAKSSALHGSLWPRHAWWLLECGPAASVAVSPTAQGSPMPELLIGGAASAVSNLPLVALARLGDAWAARQAAKRAQHAVIEVTLRKLPECGHIGPLPPVSESTGTYHSVRQIALGRFRRFTFSNSCPFRSRRWNPDLCRLAQHVLSAARPLAFLPLPVGASRVRFGQLQQCVRRALLKVISWAR